MRATDGSCHHAPTGKETEIREPGFQYDRGVDESPSRAVVAAVAEATERPAVPTPGFEGEGTKALPPLYEAVDTDALDALVASAEKGDRQCLFTFTYDAYRVTVRTRSVTVRPAT